MFKTILMTAAAALVATSAAAPAHALVSSNGVRVNGWIPNGMIPNGQVPNGQVPNAYSTQGTSTGAAGFVIDGIELPARTR
jgi:hypothetical protein